MPRDASGTYTLPTAPFQALALAKSADVNTALDDIADALTDSQSRAAPTPAQGDLNLNGHNILNLGTVVGDLDVSGDVTAPSAVVQELIVDGTAGTAQVFAGQVAGKGRWLVVAGDGTAETGSNAGSNFQISRYADDGTTALGTALTINRATGALAVTQGLTASGGITTTNIAASGSIGGVDLTASRDLGVTRNAYVTGTLNVSGTLTASGTVTAPAAQINGNLNAASLAASGNVNAGIDLGVSRNAYITGTLTVTGGTAMSGSLDTGGNITTQASVYSANEVHAGNRGIYYTGIDNDAHAVAFNWAVTRMNMYVDKTFVGYVLTGALAREEGAPAIDEQVAALEARIAALEAHVVALGG